MWKKSKNVFLCFNEFPYFNYNFLINIDFPQLYLLDFGLASKYRLSTGEHKTCGDERKAHAGTLIFCSRDAHKGIQSRRSDLESLAYNMVYWLTGSLPWINDLENQEMMQRKKRHCFADTAGFLYFCMPDPPRLLKEFFLYIKGLDVQDTPDYDGCQQFITKALMEHGYQDLEFDFDNLEGWRLVKKKISEDMVNIFSINHFSIQIITFFSWVVSSSFIKTFHLSRLYAYFQTVYLIFLQNSIWKFESL